MTNDRDWISLTIGWKARSIVPDMNDSNDAGIGKDLRAKLGWYKN